MTTTIARPVLALAAIAAIAGAAALAGGASAEQPTIKELAPPKSVIVGSVPHAATAFERMKGTALWRLWNSDELAETRKQFVDSMEEGLGEMAEELGVEKADIHAPTGELGFAIYPVLDEQSGVTRPGYMLIADYEQHADATAGIIDKWIEVAAKEDGLEHDERDVLGRTVKVFDIAKAMKPAFDEEPAADGGFGAGGRGGEDGMGMDGMGGLFDPAEMFLGGVREVYLVREKTSFMLSTDMQTLRRALEVCDGEAQESFAQRDDFQAVRAVLEQTGPGDAWAMLLTRDLGPIAMGMDPMGMVAMIGPMVKQLVGDIRGAGASWRIAGDHAMVEQTSFFYMPNGKSGLTALVDTEAPRSAPPAFVPPNAVNYASFNVEFDALPALVRSILQMVPMLAMQMEQGGDGPRPDELVAQVCACLGRKMHVIGTVERPLTPTSMSQLIAVECTKPQELENMLGAIGATMGLSGRDFLGQRIYDIPAEAMMMGGMPGMPGAGTPPPSSIGLAGGYVFTGSTPAVEQALRAVPARDAPSLGAEPSFRRAGDALGSEPAVAWGWVNIIESAEAQATISRLQMEALLKEMAKDDPELAAQMGGGDLDALGIDIDFALARRYVGPMSWVFRTTETGFVGKSYIFDAGTP